MRTVVTSVAVSILAVATTGCGISVVVGDGNTTTETRSVAASSGVDVSGFFDVHVDTTADADMVEVTCDGNLMEHLITEVRDGTLRLRVEDGVSITPRGTCSMSVTLSAPPDHLEVSGSSDMTVAGRLLRLNDADVSGSGSIVLEDGATTCGLNLDVSGSGEVDLGGVDGCGFDADISGSGSVVATGEVESIEAGLSGSGDLFLRDLMVVSADVDISGSGFGELTVTESLTARISGSGNLDIYGEPSDQDVSLSGTGNVRFR